MDSETLREAKRSLRRRMAGELRFLQVHELRSAGDRAADRLAASELWRSSGTVLTFLSMAGEISTDGLVERALAAGKRVFVPRIEGAELQFLRIAALEGPWAHGPFGIREPLSTSETWRPDGGPVRGDGTLVVVPGLAFDRSGRRLGRGKGYYDRFLSLYGQGIPRVGFCLSLQVLDEVSAGAEDAPMDALATEAEFSIL